MHENTSVVVRNYSLGYMETLSRIHGAFYRMHENPQFIHGDTYRSIKLYSFERPKIYLNLRDRMYKILDWIYKIPLGYMRAFGRILGGLFVECIKTHN